MEKAWAATAPITPRPPRTDNTMPAKFMRVLTTVVVPVEEADADAVDGAPPAAALSVVATLAVDIL